jgi:hypothetical protein
MKGFRSRYTGGWEPTEGDVKEREAWEREHGFGQERGCGQRAENGLYLTVGTSPLGVPIETYLVDPVIEWKGPRTLRAPMFIEDKKGTTHLILGIGLTYYPFVSDYVEEARRLGVSKRVPRNIKVERLSSESKFLLMHPRAIPYFEYETDTTCPKQNKKIHECIGFLWSLSALKTFKKVHEVADAQHGFALVKTPSALYEAVKPDKPTEFIDNYASGIIFAFPLSICHFEFVKRQGKAPPKLTKRIQKAGFKIEVVPS